MTTEEMQKFGKANMDTALSSLGAWTKGAQALAAAFVDYSRKSAESSAAAWEKIVGAKNLETALGVQTDYLKSSYEEFVTEATRFGEIYLDLAKETYRPFEGTPFRAPAGK
ncbi:MAG: phasin family protein [Xanthobacteraceae bacterium]